LSLSLSQSFGDRTAQDEPVVEAPRSSTAIALFDYSANGPEEINFRKGDVSPPSSFLFILFILFILRHHRSPTKKKKKIIKIVYKYPNGWWIGELDGFKGMVPSNYCREHRAAPKPPSFVPQITPVSQPVLQNPMMMMSPQSSSASSSAS
jgi:hypothetical protein